LHRIAVFAQNCYNLEKKFWGHARQALKVAIEMTLMGKTTGDRAQYSNIVIS
jgi:hypothetical protein